MHPDDELVDPSWLAPRPCAASPPHERATETPLVAPWEPLPALPLEVKDAIFEQALRANDRYLEEFIESYAFCPFSREGRRAGQTARYCHYAETAEVEPLLELMIRIAADPRQAVAQVILPFVEVDPAAWCRFCDDLTALGHRRMSGPDVLAFAALHPDLPFGLDTPYALVPLFRRAPDPTIQWVRLESLADLYRGRESGDVFVAPEDVAALLAGKPHRPALYDRVAETNASMARRLSVARCVGMLASITADARRSDQRILLEAELEPESG